MTALADIAGLGSIELDLEEGDLVTDAVVVAAVSNVDQGERLIIQLMDGTSWIAAIGLLAAAETIQLGNVTEDDERGCE